MTLEFRIEWEAGPGVMAPPLRETWARLEILSSNRVISLFWSEPTRSLRNGVYGSLFPVARWIVSNWWALLSEGLPHPAVLKGARSGGPHQDWIRRHNLFFGREGMALPDLTVFREEAGHALIWWRDPHSTAAPGRFMDDGMARVSSRAVEEGFAELVERVLARVASMTDDAVQDLRDDWAAVKESRGEERDLCERLAALGLDPYAPREESIEEKVAELDLQGPLLRDFLAATGVDRIDSDLKALRDLLHGLPPPRTARSGCAAPAPSLVVSELPYLAGYQQAGALRTKLAIPSDQPVQDLPKLLDDLWGAPDLSWVDGSHGPIEAVVQARPHRSMAAHTRSNRGRRFLLARALHHWEFGSVSESSPRLITSARDWQQACGRAFAAELLAPAEALRAIQEEWDDVEALADRFDVSPMVIQHQLTNHAIE